MIRLNHSMGVLIIGLCVLASPARGDLVLTGAGINQSAFVGLLNSYSIGASWKGDGAGKLDAVNVDADPAKRNYFANRLLDLEALDPATKIVTLNVGRNMPGVLIGAWHPGGIQDIDLADILVAKQTAQQEPIVALQASLLLHEIWEAGMAVDLGIAFDPAHNIAVSAENGELSALGSRGQRDGAGTVLKDLGAGTAELYVPWAEVPSTNTPPIKSMKMTFAYSGAGGPALTNIRPGYVGGGWEYDYSGRELQLTSLEASTLVVPEPGSLALMLAALGILTRNRSRGGIFGDCQTRRRQG